MKSNERVFGRVVKFEIRKGFGTTSAITRPGNHGVRRVWMLRGRRVRIS